MRPSISVPVKVQSIKFPEETSAKQKSSARQNTKLYGNKCLIAVPQFNCGLGKPIIMVLPCRSTTSSIFPIQGKNSTASPVNGSFLYGIEPLSGHISRRSLSICKKKHIGRCTECFANRFPTGIGRADKFLQKCYAAGIFDTGRLLAIPHHTALLPKTP